MHGLRLRARERAVAPWKCLRHNRLAACDEPGVGNPYAMALPATAVSMPEADRRSPRCGAWDLAAGAREASPQSRFSFRANVRGGASCREPRATPVFAIRADTVAHGDPVYRRWVGVALPKFDPACDSSICWRSR